MGMPKNLILERHAESEGNKARCFSKKGDDSLYTPEFRNRHNSLFHLTDRGIEQAKTVAKWMREDEWIRNNIGSYFFRYYTSSYIRALETAGYLDLPNASWFMEPNLRERDWGEMDITSDEERRTVFAESMRRRKLESFLWAPVGGESMAQVGMRTDRVMQTLHRECDGEDVIVVCHGETMTSFRVNIERIPPERFHEINSSRHPFDQINNCQILHYTRVNPETRELAPYLNWMRSVCPWDTKRSSNEWAPIVRPRYTNKELFAIAAQYPRIVE